MRSSQRQLGIPPCFPHPTGQPVESSMWAGQAASMSLSNQGIHCCTGSGYSLTTGPHPALLAVHCCFEQSCLLMPGSLTWISRESFRRRRGEECLGREGKKPPTQPPSAFELAVSFQSVPVPHQVNGWDCVTAFIQSAGALTGRDWAAQILLWAELQGQPF